MIAVILVVLVSEFVNTDPISSQWGIFLFDIELSEPILMLRHFYERFLKIDKKATFDDLFYILWLHFINKIKIYDEI